MLFSAAGALADGDYGTQTVVGSDLILPYDGYMMVDSTPLTGTRTIKFELFEASSGGAAVWTEEQPVQLYNGRFSVGLGTATSLMFGDDKDIYGADIIQGHNDLRFQSSPSSGTSIHVKDSIVEVNENTEVTGTLHATGNLSTNGNSTLGNGTNDDTTVSGDLTVNGNLKSWPEGQYCIINHQNNCTGNNCFTGHTCPSGFTATSIFFRGGSTDHRFSNQVADFATTNPSNGFGLRLCCK